MTVNQFRIISATSSTVQTAALPNAPFMMPPFPFIPPYAVPPPIMPPDFANLSDSEIRAMEGNERRHVEERIKVN